MLALAFIDEWEPAHRAAVEAVFAALQVHGATDLPDGTINLKLVSDEDITALNEQFSGNAYATDVLTFNYQEDGSPEDLGGELADVVISIDTAARQAAEAQTAVADEIGLLALHGLLHILGHDHSAPDDRADMDKLQAVIMDDAGLSYRNFGWTE